MNSQHHLITSNKKAPITSWFFEGQLAKQQNKSIVSCPYKPGTYGEAQWIKGFNSL